MKVLVLCALVAFANAAPTPTPSLSRTSYILGGSEVQISNFPWQSSLRQTGSHICGCAVMSSSKALTAAHCVDGQTATALSIYSGSNSRTSGGVETTSITYEMHGDYNNGACTFCNDIAMLSFSGLDLSNPNIAAATLPQVTSDFAGVTCTITGWGRIDETNVLPDNLMGVAMTVLTAAECQTKMDSVSGAVIGASHICVYDQAETSGSCNGDSGGPMTCLEGATRVLAGVTSWGISGGGVCMPSFPSVYTRITTHLDWINQRLP